MSIATKNEIISTAKSITKLGLSENQRNRVLADLAAADTVVSAVIAAAKLLHLR